jgi:hypothetical protein
VKKISLFAAIGIGYSTKTIHRVHDVRPKMLDEVRFLIADLAEGMRHKGIIPHQIGSAFLCGSCPECRRRILLQRQKKVEVRLLSKQKKRRFASVVAPEIPRPFNIFQFEESACPACGEGQGERRQTSNQNKKPFRVSEG